MKIMNHTQYDTCALRSLMCEAHNRIAQSEGRLKQWERLRVEVVYTRRYTASGWAVLGGTRMRLRLQRDGVKPYRVAALMDHELFHSYGYVHRQMRGWGGSWHKDDAERFRWADEMFPNGLPVMAPVPKVKTDIQVVRYQRLLARKSVWEAKYRRAERALHTLDRSIRRYERVLAEKASHATPSPPDQASVSGSERV